jgi:hypothetical protein
MIQVVKYHTIHGPTILEKLIIGSDSFCKVQNPLGMKISHFREIKKKSSKYQPLAHQINLLLHLRRISLHINVDFKLYELFNEM